VKAEADKYKNHIAPENLEKVTQQKGYKTSQELTKAVENEQRKYENYIHPDNLEQTAKQAG